MSNEEIVFLRARTLVLQFRWSEQRSEQRSVLFDLLDASSSCRVSSEMALPLALLAAAALMPQRLAAPRHVSRVSAPRMEGWIKRPGTRSARPPPPRRGGAADAVPKRVIMKFGGSSVRDAERIREVCSLVTDVYAEGTRPHLVCSAMGKTTNGLLAAADAAIAQGPTFAVKDAIGPIRELHAETAATLELEDSEPYAEVVALLDELERTLEGVAMLGELSVRIKDRVVSYAAPQRGWRVGRRRCKTSEGAR